MIVSDLALLEALPGKLAALCTARAEVGVLEDTTGRTRSRTRAEMTAARNAAMGGGILKTGSVPYPSEIAAAQAVSKTVPNDDETNASIGLRHEKGSVGGKLPRRSFLKDPLLMRGEEQIAAHALDAVLEDHLLGGATRDDVVDRLAVAAEAAIDGAFDSGGYGTWPQLAASTIASKGNDRILIESEQLRGSITHRLVSAPASA